MRHLSFALPVVAVLALGALTGCRTEPSVAAYVGDLTISTAQLAAAIDERMADDNIAAVVEPGDPEYQRLVLFQLVQQAEYRLLSAEYDVDVTDRDVQVKLDELLSGDGVQSAESVYAQLATEQMLSEIDVRENVRQALTREEIAAAQGLDGPTQDAALRQRYAEIKDQLSMIELGLITVPDQATADMTLAGLLANPGSYAQLATAYAGPYTQPSPVTSAVSDLPPELGPSVLATAVGQGFTVAVPQTGGIVVGYVVSRDVPPFEDVQDQIRLEASRGVDAAAGEVVAAFVADLDIDINPRYGSLGDNAIAPGSGGVVRILEDAGTT
ncbi:MAG: hypothetical protein H0T54_03495 [Geodermatophilaceae bacterium]|nr:hypothetical protein [Geodermatophilaceae bacterium]